MKLASIAALIVALAISPLTACESGKHKEEIKYEALSLQGKIQHQEKTVLDKSGEIKTVHTYVLVTADAKITLPEHKNCKGEPTVNLKPYVDREVTVHARGLKKLMEGKTFVYVANIESIRDLPASSEVNVFSQSSI